MAPAEGRVGRTQRSCAFQHWRCLPSRRSVRWPGGPPRTDTLPDSTPVTKPPSLLLTRAGTPLQPRWPSANRFVERPSPPRPTAPDRAPLHPAPHNPNYCTACDRVTVAAERRVLDPRDGPGQAVPRGGGRWRAVRHAPPGGGGRGGAAAQPGRLSAAGCGMRRTAGSTGRLRGL